MTTANTNNPQSRNLNQGTVINYPATNGNPAASANPAGPRPGAPLPPPPAPRANAAAPQRPAPQTSSTGNTGAKVAVGIGAAVAGGGTTAAAMAFLNNDDEVQNTGEVLTPEEQTETTPETTAESQTTATPAAQTQPSGNGGSNGNPNPGADSNTNTGEVTGENTGEVTGDNTGEVTGENTGEVTGENTGEVTGEIDEPLIEDPEDPDMLAEAIIEGDEVDPTEILESGINFTGVETVYTVEGDEVTVGTIVDDLGEEMVVVDMDNDGFFDYAADDYGNMADVSHLAMSVSDAEEQVTEGYMAQSDNEIETFENELGEDYLDDIVTV